MLVELVVVLLLLLFVVLLFVNRKTSAAATAVIRETDKSCPDFMWIVAATFLELKSIARLDRVSKQIKRLDLVKCTTEIQFAKRFDPEKLRSAYPRIPALRSIQLSGYRVTNNIVKEAVLNWKDSLESVYIKSYSINYATAVFVLDNCPRLICFTLEKAALFSEEVDLLFKMYPECSISVIDRFSKCLEIEAEIKELLKLK
jgi:hypothetical protein